MKRLKVDSISDLLENDTRLDELLADRKKRAKKISFCTWIIIITQCVLTVNYLIEWDIRGMALPLAVIAVFVTIDQGMEQEYKILQLVKALRFCRDGKSEGDGNQ